MDMSADTAGCGTAAASAAAASLFAAAACLAAAAAARCSSRTAAACAGSAAAAAAAFDACAAAACSADLRFAASSLAGRRERRVEGDGGCRLPSSIGRFHVTQPMLYIPLTRPPSPLHSCKPEMAEDDGFGV